MIPDTNVVMRLTNTDSDSITPEDVRDIILKLREARAELAKHPKDNSTPVEKMYFELFWLAGPFLQKVVNVWNELHAEELQRMLFKAPDGTIGEGESYLFDALSKFCLCPVGLPNKACYEVVREMTEEQ